MKLFCAKANIFINDLICAECIDPQSQFIANRQVGNNHWRKHPCAIGNRNAESNWIKIKKTVLKSNKSYQLCIHAKRFKPLRISKSACKCELIVCNSFYGGKEIKSRQCNRKCPDFSDKLNE